MKYLLGLANTETRWRTSWGAMEGAGRLSSHLADRSEKAMTPHLSTLAWEILWTDEPGRRQSMESLRVGYH